MKTKVLTAAIGAALGLGMAASANADSLLAPWVKASKDLGVQTYLMLKVQGWGWPDAGWEDFENIQVTNKLHYYFFQWDGKEGSADGGKPCKKFDKRGTTSPWDMVYQSISTAPAGYTGPAGDMSEPVQDIGDFDGFLIVDDEICTAPGNCTSVANEGNFTGFAYVVDLTQGLVADYKMLNNPQSTASGNFNHPSIAKQVADLLWWPQDTILTKWLVLAVGPYMTSGGEGKAPSNAKAWGGEVDIYHINQTTWQSKLPGPDPFGGQVGVYDNDEVLLSGFTDKNIICMGWVYPDELMGSSQLGYTANGGWTRVAFVTNQKDTTGAVIYRQDSSDALGFPIYTWTHETAGRPTWGVNEPY